MRRSDAVQIVIHRVSEAAGVAEEHVTLDLDLRSLGLDDAAIGEVIGLVTSDVCGRSDDATARLPVAAVVDMACRMGGPGDDAAMQHLLLQSELCLPAESTHSGGA